jgi:hypothetical protein
VPNIFPSINKATTIIYVPTGWLTYLSVWIWYKDYQILEMSLNVSSNTVSSSGKGDTLTVNVVSTNEWTASSDAPWLIIDSAKTALTFHALENQTAVERSATITVTSPGSGSQSIKVTQLAGTTGISSVDKTDFAIYPNPAATTLFINSPIQGSIVSIFDLNGILRFKRKNVDKQIDVSFLPEGIYTVKIEAKNKVWTDKFVKR